MRRAVRAIVGQVRSAELAPDVFRRGAGGSSSDLAAFTVLPYFIQGVLGVGSGLWADALIREGKAR